MIGFNFKISKNFAFEGIFFHKIRNFTDGISLFQILCNSDFYEGDHNPKFEIELIFLNIMIFEFRIFNINHKK
jgi:hypothetical protein